MKKRKLFWSFIALSTFLVSSCDSNEAIVENQVETGFYMKNSLDNLERGMDIKLDEYIGYKDETQEELTFKSYVLSGDESGVTSYIEGGNGNSNTLVLANVGDVVLLLEASNGDKTTLTLEVGESKEFSKIQDKLASITDNYKIEVLDRDSQGNQIVAQTVYRSSNYVYDETNGLGYILSSLDDNVYNFTLDSDELEVTVPPVTDKATFKETYTDLNFYAKGDLWSFTTLFSNDPNLPQFSKYHYMAVYSTYTPALFNDVGAQYAQFSMGGYTYIPYSIMVSLVGDYLYFLPIYATSDLSYYAYTNEIRLSGVNETKVEALDNYVASFIAPPKEDTTSLQEDLRYLTEVMNYTVTCVPRVIDEEGVELSKGSAEYNVVFGSRYRRSKVKKINKDIVFNDNFSGTPGTDNIIPGGLINIDNKTYRYNSPLNDGNYELLEEYVQYPYDYSFANWWSYDNMGCYLPTLAFNVSYLNNSYPSKTVSSDGKVVTYHLTNNISNNNSIISGSVGFGFHFQYGSQVPLTTIADISGDAYVEFESHYDDSGILEELIIRTRYLFTPSIDDMLSKNYWLTLETTVSDIGVTDLSEIKESLLTQYEEVYGNEN